MDLRAVQAPIKDRYRQQPGNARITLTAKESFNGRHRGQPQSAAERSGGELGGICASNRSLNSRVRDLPPYRWQIVHSMVQRGERVA